MALREFTDPKGTKWQVYNVIPSSTARMLTADIKDGWIVFESATQKIRLVSPPPDWETCSEDQLLAYLGRGVSVPKTTIRGNTDFL